MDEGWRTLFDDEQIRVRVAEGRCLICGVQQTDDTPKCTLQPLDIPPGTSLEAPHLWPSPSEDGMAVFHRVINMGRRQIPGAEALEREDEETRTVLDGILRETNEQIEEE